MLNRISRLFELRAVEWLKLHSKRSLELMFETRHACIFVAMKVDYLPFSFIAIFRGKLFDYQRVHPNLPSIFYFNIPSIFHQYSINID